MIRAILLAAASLCLGGVSAASAQPAGSYRQTCTDVSQRGPYLEAYCRDVTGRFVDTRLDLRGCDGGISNNNGRLICERGERRAERGYGGRGYDDDRFDDRRRDGERRRRTESRDDDDRDRVENRRSSERRRFDNERDRRFDDRGDGRNESARRFNNRDDDDDDDYRPR